MGHQASKIKDEKEKEKLLKWLEELEFGHLGLPKPDAVIFLHIPAEIGQKLVEQKGERNYIGNKKDIAEEDLEHQKESEKNYISLSEKFGWKKIECVDNGKLLSKEEVAERVWNALNGTF